MRVLITGGSGFIGTAVARCLLQQGLDVRVMDISDVKLDGLEKVNGSILDTNMVNKAVHGCDCVVHLAAMLGVRKTEQWRLECLNLNILGTINILEACVKEKVGKILLSSSSEVYGEPSVQQISETTEVKPKSVYAVTKLAGEEYLKAYNLRHGLKYSIVRFFNVYGDGQVAEFVLPRFVRAVLDGNSPTVYGTGEQVRSFCHAEDAARGVHLALTSEAANSDIFNIGNDTEPISMKDLALKVIALSGKDLKPKFIDMSVSDRNQGREILFRRPEIAKARSVLGYAPTISLEDGINRLLASGDIPTSWIEPMNF